LWIPFSLIHLYRKKRNWLLWCRSPISNLHTVGALPHETVYSGPPNFERFDVRTTWNTNKKFAENPVLKLGTETRKSNKESLQGKIKWW
jgi:hypothetical protein